MIETTFGNIPWDDLHHTALSQTNGEDDGRWLFINANNTPRIARIDLTRFETEEILLWPFVVGSRRHRARTRRMRTQVRALAREAEGYANALGHYL